MTDHPEGEAVADQQEKAIIEVKGQRFALTPVDPDADPEKVADGLAALEAIVDITMVIAPDLQTDPEE
ncbi:hypothetical protein ACWC0C_38415 [Streptomyces sp. NPDC001709]